jgi:Cu+-exporting ATPase
MALEPVIAAPPSARTEYVCPMHPQIVRREPGNCPICGMILEPRTLSVKEEDNPELRDMTRRFRISLGLTSPVLVAAMSGSLLHQLAPARFWTWFELILASPVVLWGGWPFFVRAWRSLVNRSLNMFTLIGLGVGVAYGYSLIGALLPDIFPAAFPR